MTEKRFTLKEYVTNCYGILDNKEEIAYADHKSAFTFCDLLNELHEEVEYLKPLANENTHYIADMEEDIISFKQTIKKLVKENERLKSKIEVFEESITIANSLNEKIDELEKENEQLKQEIETLQEQIAHFDIGDV